VCPKPPTKKTKIRRIVLSRRAPWSAFPARDWLRAMCFAVAFSAALISAGCHKKAKPRIASTPKVTIAPRIGATEAGTASWYGYPYHGRRAANGEVYDMEKLTAAHRTLPFETWVEVKNLSNEKTVKVRITDRGPFIDGRIIDLSKAAARNIELIGPGIGPVRITVVEAPPPDELPVVNLFTVQIGAFRDRDRAESLRAGFESQYGFAKVVYRAGAPPLYRVLVGRESSLESANALMARIQEKNPGPAFVVRLDETDAAGAAAQHE
jgi:rare lipoprotein A